MISINEGVDVWISCQMDWFMEAAVTHWWSLFWACPTSPICDWLTGWLNECLTENQCKVIQIFVPPLFVFFPVYLHLFLSDLKVKKKDALSRLLSSFWGKIFRMVRKWMDIHWQAAMPFSFYCSLSLFCAFSLSFCISLAGRCYQCSYCRGWKSRGAHETPWQWAHAFPSVGFLRSVLCVCVQWLEVCDKACVCLESTSLPLSYSPVLAAGCQGTNQINQLWIHDCTTAAW